VDEPTMKILNLFAGIGGNRTLWGNQHTIVAVESDPDIAQIYKQRFPNDSVVEDDAYLYLEQNLDLFDFISAGPKCQTHSRLNTTCQNMRIPDMRLYGLIIFLDRFHKGLWCVENVVPYYKPLIHPTVQLGRHLFWSNFNIPEKKFPQPKGTLKDLPIKELQSWHNITETKNRRYLWNCVDYRIGKYILDCAIRPKQKTLF
jgi:DNA (cytosine-5)-methyltransferase 1